MKTNNYLNINKTNKFIIKKKDILKLTHSKKKVEVIKKSLKIASKCIYSTPAYDYRKIYRVLETNNIFKFINNYMYGSCHEITFLMEYLLKINRISSRILRLSSKNNYQSHWVLETYLNNKWILVDPTLGLLFRKLSEKNYLSGKEIKSLPINQISTNKKISFKKFSNLNKKHIFFYQKKKSFVNAKEKYLNLFFKMEKVYINDNKYSYKKKILKHNNIKNFMIFKEFDFKLGNFNIKKTNTGLGLKLGKLVKSDRFIKYKNYVLRKKISTNTINIVDFPFPILDIRLTFKEKKNKILINMHNKKIIINSKKRKLWVMKKLNKNIFHNAIRNVEIKNNYKIYFFEILFLASKGIR